jgi:hypothetical protein
MGSWDIIVQKKAEGTTEAMWEMVPNVDHFDRICEKE